MKASDYSLAIVPLLPERRRSLPMATNQVRAAPGEHEASGLTPEWGDKLKEMRQRRRSSLSDRVRQSPTDGKELLKGTSAATTTEGESDAGTEQLTARVKTWLHRRRSSADQRGDTLSRSRLKQQEPRELPPAMWDSRSNPRIRMLAATFLGHTSSIWSQRNKLQHSGGGKRISGKITES